MARTQAPDKQTISVLMQHKAILLARLQPAPDLLRASYVKQYLTCGKPNCRCRRGFKHGPFYYLVQCLGTGRVRKFLLKTPAQRKQARAGIAAQTGFIFTALNGVALLFLPNSKVHAVHTAIAHLARIAL